MNFSPIFPTVIGHSEDLEILSYILELAKEYLEDDTKIYKNSNYRTTYSHPANDSVDKRLTPFCDMVRASAAKWLHANGFPNHPIKSINIFFNDMRENDYHLRHSHPNCHLSGVYYLNVPNGSGDFCFVDPRPSFNVLDLSGGTQTGRFRIKPTNGLVILFPSWLEHEVETSTCTEPRISAPFNIVFDL